jgi:hypothetical protein
MQTHTSEDVLERYSMSKLSEVELAPVEEHLLVCPLCCERLTWLDRFVDSIRAADDATVRVAEAEPRN